MSLQAEDISDITMAGLRHIRRKGWVEFATDIQEFKAMPQILKKERVTIEDGYGIQWDVMHDHSHSAKDVDMNETDNTNIPDVLQQARVDWKHTHNSWGYDARELAMNRRPARIVDIQKVRRAACFIDLAEHIEEIMFGNPDSSANSKKPYGFKYWIPKKVTGASASTSTGEFGGKVASGFTTVANLNPTTYPRWACWTQQYVNAAKLDLVRKMKTAYRKTGFKSPVPIPSLARGSDRHVIYTNLDTLQDIENVGEQQNENLGKDIASNAGLVTFWRNPIEWVPQLDTDTDDPLYFINWAHMCTVFLRGWYLRESQPKEMDKQHTKHVNHVDMTWNTKMLNRRRFAVLCKTANNP